MVVEQGLVLWVHVGVIGLLCAELQVLSPGPHPVGAPLNDGHQPDVGKELFIHISNDRSGEKSLIPRE